MTHRPASLVPLSLLLLACSCDTTTQPTDVVADVLVFTPLVPTGESVLFLTHDEYSSTLSLERASADGPPTVIAKLPYPGADIPKFAADDTDAYFAMNGAVLRVSLMDGSESWIGALNPNLSETVSPIAIDASNAYWFRYGLFGAASLIKSAKDGSSETLLYGSSADLIANPTDVFVDASSVYFVARNSDTGSSPNGVVVSVPLAGGAATTWATGQANPTGIVSDGTNLYWTTAGAAPDGSDGAVWSMPIASGGVGAPLPVATQQQDAWGITLVRGAVTWISGAWAAQYANGTTSFILRSSASDHIQSVAAAGDHTFWATLENDLSAGAIHVATP